MNYSLFLQGLTVGILIASAVFAPVAALLYDAAREVSTEFVSTWRQELFKNQRAFIKKYPEFFQGILKVLSNGK